MFALHIRASRRANEMFKLLCVLMLATIASSCVHPDCDVPDCGSCGML